MYKLSDNNIIDYINISLLQVKSSLEPEAVYAIEHYLIHDEYEMAFEGLFTEIMKLSNVPPIDHAKGLEVAQLCKLNELTYFDMNFWSKFEDFVKRSAVSDVTRQ